MKTRNTFLLSLFMVLFPVASFASTQDYLFVFRHKIDFEAPAEREPQTELKTYEYSTQAESYEAAFRKAAKACFQHFKAGRSLSEDEGLSIIDTCANPRGS